MYEPYGGGAGEAFENTAVSHQCSLFTHSSNIVHTYPYPSLCSSASSLYFNSRYARRAWHTQTLRSLVQLPCSLQLSLRSRGVAYPNPFIICSNSLLSAILRFTRRARHSSNISHRAYIVQTHLNPSLISSASSPFCNSHYVRRAKHRSNISKPFAH